MKLDKIEDMVILLVLIKSNPTKKKTLAHAMLRILKNKHPVQYWIAVIISYIKII